MFSTPNSKATLTWASPSASADVSVAEEEDEETKEIHDESSQLIQNKVEGIVTALAHKKHHDLVTFRRYLTNNPDLLTKSNITSQQRKEDQTNDKPIGQPSTLMSSPVTALKLSPRRPVTEARKVLILKPASRKAGLLSSWTAFDVFRCILLDLPVATLFLSLVVAYGVRHFHDHYFVPLLHQIRRTDEQLLEEFTYYERTCTATDITTHDIQDLVVTNSSTAVDAVHQMMTHGALLIRQVLPPDIVRDLRRYIVERNSHLSEADVLPVSQGDNRLSFAIDATESEIVTLAIEHVAHNDVLRPLVQKLVGDTDPAVTEITAITSFFGCIDQAWHPDVKQDGNAAKYARTFSHSYSLFIPLQDTTTAMGATDICPGSHYCSNDLINVCEANKVSFGNSLRANVWRAGDAALLNQQVWHRGARHSDQQSLPRVLFILSFMARPSVDDPRQFSRGTYFHMKWNMWGHTWRDLMDAHYSMIKPFSILRSLGLWKPSADRHWGYDVITANMFRMANNQQGMQARDLVSFVNNVMDKMYCPRWFQGPLPTDDDDPEAWERYIRETVNNAVRLLRAWTAGALCFYVVSSFVVSRCTHRSTFARMLHRMLLVFGVMAIGALFSFERFRTSKWAVNVKRGELFYRPFPSQHLVREQHGNYTSVGFTTLPNRADVLVGTRFDADYLGAYNQWLDYHPGNVAFQSIISVSAPLFQSYSGLPNSFQEQILSDVISHMTEGSRRFLEQEPETGAWMLMSNEHARKHARTELSTHGTIRRRSLLQSLRSLVAYYRFGRYRRTIFARMAVSILYQLQARVLEPATLSVSFSSQLTLQHQIGSTHLTVRRHFKPRFKLGRNITRVPPIMARRANMVRETQPDANPKLKPGDLVISNFEGRGIYLLGSIATVFPTGFVDVAYANGDVEYTVDPSRLRTYVPIVEMATVLVAGQDNEEWTEGFVSRVMPNGQIDVVYERGEKAVRIGPGKYRIIS